MAVRIPRAAFFSCPAIVLALRYRKSPLERLDHTLRRIAFGDPYRVGMDQQQVADLIGCTPRTVNYELERQGVRPVDRNLRNAALNYLEESQGRTE